MRTLIGTFAVILTLTLLPCSGHAQTISSHADLDWTAPYRWVHIDNVDPKTYMAFESARKEWLKALTKDGKLLGDGRPLFWSSTAPDANTYFTFYPFKAWADMDARNKMAVETKRLVGDSADKQYDSGDSTLIPPHGSEIWRRVADADIVCEGTDSLTDMTAGVGRMDFRLVDWSNWKEFSTAYDTLQTILKAEKYPLACRLYSNVYGGKQGDYILFWMAKDEAALNGAPEMRAFLKEKIGSERAEKLVAALEKYFPVQKTYHVVRRLDMSNLGQ
ncbi:MAG: hypothetical protein WAU88_01675 [Candidatus Zixiibacteriota bacterium]